MRGQSAFELMIVVAMALVILLAVFYNSQEQIISSQSVYAYAVAQKSVSDLAFAAESVHYEGVGAKKKVQVVVPEKTVGATIGTDYIKITLRHDGKDSDAVARVGFNLCGASSLTSTPGTYDVWVTSKKEGCILVGQSAGLEVGPALLYANEFSNTTTRTIYRNLTYTNTGETTITVDVNVYWSHTAVNVSLNDTSDSSFSLVSGEKRNVTLNITLNSASLNTYAGNVTANASNSDVVVTEVVVEVSTQVCGASTCSAASNVSYVAIDTFKNSTYGPQKYIFDASENVSITGDSWDSNVYVWIELFYPNNTAVGSPYPRNAYTDGSGAFTDTLFSTAGYTPGIDYVVNVTGPSGGTNTTVTDYFNITSCS